MKAFKVEYTIAVPQYAEFNNNTDYEEFKCIDPGVDLPYIYVPIDAIITEIKPPVEDGIYVHTSGVLYKKSMTKWYNWNRGLAKWTEIDMINLGNEHGFVAVLARVDA